MFLDCHVHLDSFSDAEVGDILLRAEQVGVRAVISAGTTIESTRRSLELSAQYAGFFSGVGIHPMDIRKPFSDDTYETLRDLALSTEKALVISEIGLDFMEGAPDRAIQYPAFRGQIGLARELGLPIVFHSRESHEEVFRVLREERAYEVGGAMHYFQADFETAQRAIDLGFYVSLARPLLRLPHLQEAAAEDTAGLDRPGDGRRAAAVQVRSGELDGTEARCGGGGDACETQGYRRWGGGGGHESERQANAGEGVGGGAGVCGGVVGVG